MKLLLDTHTLLWFALDDKRLSAKAEALTTDPANDVLISPASYWEIAIKISRGKYELDVDFVQFMETLVSENNFEILPIAPAHAAAVAELPFHHRDPFDRMLISQAIVEKIPILSADDAFESYAVARLW